MGGMGMMGGGMRSVPPTSLPFADLKPGQTRHLPTRAVSLNPPDPQAGVRLPEKGEALEIGDIRDLGTSARVQKALARLQKEKVSTQVSQLVMWNVASGLDWPAIAELSRSWANRFELALARDFVDRLDGDATAEGETGQILFQIEGKDPADEAKAAELKKAIDGKVVLGLRAGMGIPPRPNGPTLACRVQVKSSELQVQLSSSDPSARNWIPYGKFTLPIAAAKDDAGVLKLADGLVEGLIGRLVRAQIVKGSRQKGKLTYGIRIDNASPVLLNGLAIVGVEGDVGQEPRILAGISIAPRRSMTVPVSEEAVKQLGLKRGIRLTALDLSGL
jgi:hypothetical protein